MTAATRSRSVSGRTITWREAGSGPDLLVLLHAVGLSSAWWEDHLAALPADLLATTRVVALDLPGHGGSDAVDPVTLERIAAAVATFLVEERSAGRLDIVGVSMGGMVAQHLAATVEGVTGLVLVATAASFPDAARAVIRKRAADVRAEGAAGFAPRTVERWFAPDLLARDAPVVVRARDDLAALDAEQHARCWEAIAQLETRPLLSDVRCPAVVVAGGADTSVPLERAQELVAALPDGDLVIVEDGSHLFAFERTDWLRPMLARLEGPLDRSRVGSSTDDRTAEEPA